MKSIRIGRSAMRTSMIWEVTAFGGPWFRCVDGSLSTHAGFDTKRRALKMVRRLGHEMDAGLIVLMKHGQRRGRRVFAEWHVSPAQARGLSK